MASLLAPLALITSELKGSAALTDVVPAGRISNHLPQESALPYIRYRWQPGETSTMSDKQATGYSGEYIVDIWTDSHGDREALAIADLVTAVLDRREFAGDAASVALFLSNVNVFLEPDGFTHHCVLTFNHLYA